VIESVFEFLFKYRPVVFENGHLAFGAPVPLAALVLAGAVVAVPALITYARVRGKSRRRDRVVLGFLRLAALAVLLFCLFRPALVISSAVPQQNVLGILIDDSRSMQVADRDAQPRSEFVRQAFGADSRLLAELSRRFTLRFFRFSGSAERVDGASALTYGGSRTDLAAALDRAREELSGAPLAGLVLVTDGAHNAGDAQRFSTAALGPTDPLLSLRARSVPVFTVGVGRAEWSKDIEVGRVEAPRTVLKGTSLVADVLVSQRGFGGSTVQLVVEDSGRIVGTQPVRLPAEGEAVPVRVRVPTTQAGARLLRFRIAPQSGEMVAQNNEQTALVVVQDRREKILYIEGEPRFELKFIRRAVEDDENLQVVGLLRSAENKFLRLGVEDSLELIGGFPKTREELFAYRGIILGSVEASFFTLDQLRMIADFVSERGGGLLALGGRRAFAEGGYAGTPLEDVLPVVLDGAAGDSSGTGFFAELTVAPTPAGRTHAATQIAESEGRSAERWKALPPASAVNPIRRTKPGAITLLTGSGGDARRQIVLAYQRYGRGKAIALPIQDSWVWQMHASIPVDDVTHETFWRQTLRWLVSGVPDRVEVTASAERVNVGEPVVLRAEVSDPRYVRVNDAVVEAHWMTPGGERPSQPMEWTVERDGEYRASLPLDQPGVWAVRVRAQAGKESLPSELAFIQSGALPTEFFGAEMREPLLKRIAKETGGRFYTPETVAALPEDVMVSGHGVTVQERKELWDMPVVFLLLVTLVAAEWGYRRARGLA
jgi:hypothetical protein